jgi:hypothetical protein
LPVFYKDISGNAPITAMRMAFAEKTVTPAVFYIICYPISYIYLRKGVYFQLFLPVQKQVCHQ